uniref:PSI domain-containing protein n=1 Tax=Trichuris muris TaxID=70415 RepID=A0A5S6QJ79_TRIMR
MPLIWFCQARQILFICSVFAAFHQCQAISTADVTYSEDQSLPFLHRRLKREEPPYLEGNGKIQSIDGLETPEETFWWMNATHQTVDHKYYTVHIFKPEANKFKDYWQSIPDLLRYNSTVKGEIKHAQLSNSYRRAMSQKLSFKFPFYGHLTENITIATGGFVYVGEYVHNWLAATQYIAPLMANFDTMVSEDSFILYADTGDMFVVEWNSVVLRTQQEAGNFTFQLTLHKNGDIWFVYKEVPIAVVDVSDVHHPRKVGLSDAYLFTHTIITLSRRIIYEYHRIEIPFDEIKTGTVVDIRANPVCISFTNCWDCMNVTLKEFNCSWCNVPTDRGSSFCSDEAGLHRRRQDWLFHGCNTPSADFSCGRVNNTVPPSEHLQPAVPGAADPKNDLTGQSSSSSTKGTPSMPKVPGAGPEKAVQITADQVDPGSKTIDKTQGLSSGGVVCLLFVIISVACLVGWLAYAYNNPHSRSGQFLIRYRPARWRFGDSRSDIRYTASVHM